MTYRPKNYLEAILGQPKVAPPEPGTLRTVTVKDQAGRTITSFEGSPSAWMNYFASPARRLTGINTQRKK